MTLSLIGFRADWRHAPVYEAAHHDGEMPDGVECIVERSPARQQIAGRQIEEVADDRSVESWARAGGQKEASS